jgi:hypothetical protein
MPRNSFHPGLIAEQSEPPGITDKDGDDDRGSSNLQIVARRTQGDSCGLTPKTWAMAYVRSGRLSV